MGPNTRETLGTAKKEIEEIKNRNNTVSESNSEMAKQIQELKREYDSMKQKLTKELEEEKRYKNNFKKRESDSLKRKPQNAGHQI